MSDEAPKVIAWCPKHEFMRSHTDALYLCKKGRTLGDSCGKGEYRLLLPDPVDVFGRPLTPEVAEHLGGQQ